MGSSGGGSSGKVEYPAYLQTIHGKFMDNAATDTLTFSMVDLLNDAYTTNPYADANLVAYTGRAIVDNSGAVAIPTMASALASVIAALPVDVVEYFNTNLPIVATNIDDVLNTDAGVTAASNAFASVIEPGVQADRTKFDMDVVLLGAAMSSAYALGKNLLEARRMERIGMYDAELRSRLIIQRNEMVITTMRELVARKLTQVQVTKEVYSLSIEVAKLKILNEREYFKDNAEYLHDKALWRFEAMQYGFNAIAAIGGGSMVPKSVGMSKGGSTLAGALGGAAAGAYVGSVVPGIGTAIGAVAGGIIGGLGGFLS